MENPNREKPRAEKTTEKSTIIVDVTMLGNGEIDEENLQITSTLLHHLLVKRYTKTSIYIDGRVKDCNNGVSLGR